MRGKPIRTGLEGVTAGTDFEGSGVHSTLVVAYESGAAPTGSEPETVLAWTESSPIEFEWEKRRLVLEATADPEVAFEFVEEGTDPVEFSVLVAGAAFTPAVPWL